MRNINTNYEVKKSHQMMKALYKFDIFSYKLLNLAGSKFKKNLYNNKENPHMVIIKRLEIANQIPLFSKSHKILPRTKKVVEDLKTNNSIAIPNHAETMLNWEMEQIVKNISYDTTNQTIAILFCETTEVENLFNPPNATEFDLDQVKNLFIQIDK